MVPAEPRVGIEALNIYAGVAAIPVRDLFVGRQLDPARLDNLMMEERSIGLPCEDPITHAVNAAKPILDLLSVEQRDCIEMLITSSESGVDFSKSIASYVHAHLGLSRSCRLLEVKQACYAATAAVQMAIGYVASGVSPGAKALVIATDVALVDAKAAYAEAAMGVGAAAILVGDEPSVLAVDFGAFGNHSYEILDSARPAPDFDIADVDRSLFTYLDCLSGSFDDYAARVDDVDFASSFRHLALHTPFSGMVKAAHRKMMREHSQATPEEIEDDFRRRVAPSLRYPSRVGNLCSGSVFLALASIVDHASLEPPSRVGLFSYGSGCSSEFWSGLVDPGARQALDRMRLGEHLDRRCRLSFEEYEALLAENRRCLVPQADRDVGWRPYEPILRRVENRHAMLMLKQIRGYHRQYEWI